MRARLSWALLLGLGTLSWAQAAIVDSTGVAIDMTTPARCIVTLMPSLAEMASDLLGDDLGRICGVTEQTTQPAILSRKPSVGRYDRLSLESIAALKPDLVIALKEGNSKAQIDRLRQLGISVFVFSLPTLSSVGGGIRQMGELLGKTQQAQSQAQGFEKKMADIRERAQQRRKRGQSAPRVFFQLDDRPIVTAGRNTFLDEALTLLGASNVSAPWGAGYPRVSREAVVKEDPDWILVFTLAGPEAAFQAMALKWGEFPQLKARKGDHIRLLRLDALLRTNSNLIEGLLVLERLLYGSDR